MPASPQDSLSTATRNMLRWLMALFVLGMACFELCINFKGLKLPEAMYQAQLARHVAQGEGLVSYAYTPAQLASATLLEKDGYQLNWEDMRDKTSPILPVLCMAAALNITGADDLDAMRMQEGASLIYWPDRVIAGVSMIFFLLALFLSYLWIKSLFDESVALCTLLLMTCSGLFLDFASSGLPQTMLLSFFFAALLLLKRALSLHLEAAPWGKILPWYSASIFCLCLMVLSSWMALFLVLGLLVYIAINFRPRILYLLLALAILVMMLALPYLRVIAGTYSLLGDVYFGLYNNFGAGAEMLQRSLQTYPLGTNTSAFIIRLVTLFFEQWSHIYSYMGAILVTPFFFLALLYPYRSPLCNSFKWAGLIMFVFAALGMALFGAGLELHSTQLLIVLSPLFIAYGISLVFAILARQLQGRSFYLGRNAIMVLLIVISAAPKLLSIPMPLYHAMCFDVKATPHWPPYYPTILSTKLVDQTNEQDIILSDQPWALAWYANRKALWTPLKVENFTQSLLPLIQSSGIDVQGLLVTPASYSSTGLSAVIKENGDFIPAALEGMLLLLSPKKNFLFTEIFDASDLGSIASIVSSKGLFPKRIPIYGAQILLYKK